jgi:hypothetical protein
MPDGSARISVEIADLVGQGRDLAAAGLVEGNAGKRAFGAPYQAWYSQAMPVVHQLLPERYEEFCRLYRDEEIDSAQTRATYTISDYIHGRVRYVGQGQSRRPSFDFADAALGKLTFQVDILAAAAARVGALVADIQGTLEASLLDDELETAAALLAAKHLRSAGVIAGVVLERHLASVLSSHSIKFTKQRQIGNLNDALKQSKIYDVAHWRQIQRFGDIRNLCGHDGERDPTVEEVQELIAGTEKVIVTVF